MAEATSIEAVLNGFFDPEFVPTERIVTTLDQAWPGVLPPDANRTTRIGDGRALQHHAAEAGGGCLSEASFFEEHGFVLLPHESKVQDWEVDLAQPDPNADVMRNYLPEVEEMVRQRLLPGQAIEMYQGPPLRRGTGTVNPTYASGVHSDYGLTPDDYQEGIEAFTTPEIAQGWRMRYDQPDVLGAMVINFWRPVYSDGPLCHMPLAVCQPSTVSAEDVIPMGFPELTPTGRPTNQSALRLNAEQRWYYYPGMTCDEVLAFKNFQCMKADPEPQVYGCFHTAFEEPGAPSGVPDRQSVEHRVQIFLLHS